MLLLGCYLILAGVAGYASNPEGAKTALMSGGLFGSLCLIWSFFAARGLAWSKIAALATMALLTAAFIWRSIAGWMAVAGGNDTKLFAASLITSMLIATAISAFFVLTDKAKPSKS